MVCLESLEYHLLSLLYTPTGSDFELSGSTGFITLVIQPSDQTLSGTVNITEDNIFEPDESIQLQLSRPINSPAELGSVRTTTVTIEDNEGENSYLFLYATPRRNQ